eukprot:835401-Prymnesium_polylepis.1
MVYTGEFADPVCASKVRAENRSVVPSSGNRHPHPLFIQMLNFSRAPGSTVKSCRVHRGIIRFIDR